MESVPCMTWPGRRAAIALLTALASGYGSTQDAARTYPLSLTAGSRLLIDAKINGRAVVALLDSVARSLMRHV